MSAHTPDVPLAQPIAGLYIDDHAPTPTPNSSYGPNQTPNPPSLGSLLSHPLRITISDNRTFIGLFACTDSSSNIILQDTEEFPAPPTNDAERAQAEQREMYYPRSQRGEGEPRWGRWMGEGGEEGKGREEGRLLGMIMIPGKEIRRVEIVPEGREDREARRGPLEGIPGITQ